MLTSIEAIADLLGTTTYRNNRPSDGVPAEATSWSLDTGASI